MKNKRGFTLVELLAVIAILAILIIVVLPNFVSSFSDAKKKAAKIQENEIVDSSKLVLEDYCTNKLNEEYNCSDVSVAASSSDTTLKYTCLKTIQEKKYIDDIVIGGKKCYGFVLYNKETDSKNYSNHKTYIRCGDAYETDGISNIVDPSGTRIIEICSGDGPITPTPIPDPEPEPDPIPEPEPDPTPINAQFYFNKQTAFGGSEVGTTTATCTPIVYGGSCTISVPEEVTNSVGKYNSPYIGVSSSAGNMGNGNLEISNNSNFYAKYSKKITNYYYNGTAYTQRNIFRNEYINNDMTTVNSVLSTTNDSTNSNVSFASGPGSSVWVGLSTGADTTTEYSTINDALTTTSDNLYAVYKFNITFNKGPNISSVGATSGNCLVTYNSASCDVTLPSITPSSGYTSAGWSLTSGDTSGSAAGSKYSVTTNNTVLYANANDSSKPLGTIASTSTLKTNSQTATISCEDSSGIVSYYWGTSSTGGTYTNVTNNTTYSTTKTVSSPGTYYLFCKDSAGNVSNAASKTYYNYTVKNMRLKATGSGYTTDNYDLISNYTYLAPSGTTLTLSSIYTVPDHSRTGRFQGYSLGNPSTTAASPSTSVPTLKANTVYTMWFSRNLIKFKYQVQSDETILEGTYNTSSNNTNAGVYSWSKSSDGYVQRTTVNTGSSTTDIYTPRYGVTSINHYDNSPTGWFQIVKKGKKPVSGAEWICVSGCASGVTTMSQASYSITNTDTQLCDTNTNDCTIVIKANFRDCSYSTASTGASGEITEYKVRYGTYTSVSYTNFTNNRAAHSSFKSDHSWDGPRYFGETDGTTLYTNVKYRARGYAQGMIAGACSVKVYYLKDTATAVTPIAKGWPNSSCTSGTSCYYNFQNSTSSDPQISKTRIWPNETDWGSITSPVKYFAVSAKASDGSPSYDQCSATLLVKATAWSNISETDWQEDLSIPSGKTMIDYKTRYCN